MEDALNPDINSGAAEPEGEAGKQWYVMRDLKRSNAKDPAWKMLGERGFTVFTPMHERLRTIGSRKVRETVPVITDLVFVLSDRESLDYVVDRTDTLQYRYLKGAPYKTPMTVGDKEMERFIRAVGSGANATYFTPQELTPDMVGRKVRIVDGPLAGYEGSLLKVRGSRKRKLLISIPQLVIAAVEVEPEFIELISN